MLHSFAIISVHDAVTLKRNMSDADEDSNFLNDEELNDRVKKRKHFIDVMINVSVSRLKKL